MCPNVSHAPAEWLTSRHPAQRTINLDAAPHTKQSSMCSKRRTKRWATKSSAFVFRDRPSVGVLCITITEKFFKQCRYKFPVEKQRETHHSGWHHLSFQGIWKGLFETACEPDATQPTPRLGLPNKRVLKLNEINIQKIALGFIFPPNPAN